MDVTCGPYEGTSIYLGIFLPMKETVPACSLETREEITVETGELIHCVKIDGRLYGSQQFLDIFKDNTNGRDKQQ